jgi:hypothetical protein
MNLFESFPDQSRVWVYGADRILSNPETAVCNRFLSDFAKNWTSHQMPLNAKSLVVFNAILVFAVNEETHAASGCSIDKSVALVKEIGEKLNINFFNRLNTYVISNNSVSIFEPTALKAAIKEGTINANTMVVNTQVLTVGDIKNNFIIPFNKSWASKYLVQTA